MSKPSNVIKIQFINIPGICVKWWFHDYDYSFINQLKPELKTFSQVTSQSKHTLQEKHYPTGQNDSLELMIANFATTKNVKS